jgi:peptidoglycan hydrolase-like protein with peptidoglycan-binding domain
VTTPAPAAVSAPVAVLTSEINPGARSDEVTTLQTLLAKDPTIYPEGTVSGFYGPKTTAAVKNFQAKYGLPQVGRVGPATLAKINEVYGSTSVSTPATSSAQTQTADQIQSQIESIQQQIQSLTGASSVSATFSSGLRKGDKGDSVKQLQQVLNSDPDTQIAESGVGSPGSETTLFGALTEKAIQRFQVKYGIAGPGDVGYGYVGPKTRTKLNELSGGSSAPVTPESPSSQAPAPLTNTSTIDQITAQIQAIQDQIKALQGQ